MTLTRTTDALRLPGRSRRTRVQVLVALLSIGALLVGAALSVTRASALYEEITETGAPGMLQLRANSTKPLWSTIAPGESMQWLIEASLTDADRGRLALELRSGGALVAPAGLTAAVVSCDRPFATGQGESPRCEGSTRTELQSTPLQQISTMDDGRVYSLADLEQGHPRYLLVTLALPRSAEVAAGAQAVVGLGLHAAGDSESQQPPSPGTPPGGPDPDPQLRGPLAMTGDDLLALVLLAAGLIGVGAYALLRRNSTVAAEGRQS